MSSRKIYKQTQKSSAYLFCLHNLGYFVIKRQKGTKMKTFIKYILWLLGLRKTLPASTINKIKVVENSEPLVELKSDGIFFFSKDLALRPAVYLRKEVLSRLKNATKQLPDGYFFKILSAYRSSEEQLALWNKEYAYFKRQNSKATDAELTKMTKAVCADPRQGYGGHQTGGAIDLCLCDKNGKEFDMGTDYLSKSPEIKTFSKNISPLQKENRKILYDALASAGFINYPNEWWHYCFGDKMWAAYSKKKTCFYTKAEPPQKKAE